MHYHDRIAAAGKALGENDFVTARETRRVPLGPPQRRV